MEDRDFRVGDKVTCLIYGRGVVSAILDPDFTSYPIKVEFNTTSHFRFYRKDGVGAAGEGYNNLDRTLYHGHNITIEVIEEDPPRRTFTKYVNIRKGKNGYIYVCGVYDTVEIAERYAKNPDFPIVAVASPIEIPEDE